MTINLTSAKQMVALYCLLIASSLVVSAMHTSWFPPPYSAPWPLPNSTLCGVSYKPKDVDLSGLKKYTDGDSWIRAVETDNNCDKSAELSKYGIKCIVGNGMKVLEFAAAVYTLSQQVWLPKNTVIQGKADPNVPGNPRKRPNLKEHTLFMPGDWECNPTQYTSWAHFSIYNSYLKCMRKGFLMNSNTVLRNFVAQGAAEDGQGLGMGLSGGGMVELPGCGTSYASKAGCGGPDEKNDDAGLKFPNKTFWTGYDGGKAVHNVLVENLRLNDLLAKDSSNVGFWSSMTTDDSAHTNITFRKIISMKTNQDGVNVHGSVVNWSGSDLHFENTGDDVYAVWGAGADTKTSGMASGRCPRLTNVPATDISYDRIFAKQKAGGGYGTCMSTFGGRKVTIDHMLCCEEHGESEGQGMFNIEKDFCALYPAGETNITVIHSRWFRGTHDLCSAKPDGQWEDDDGLHSISLDNDPALCKPSSRKGLCSGLGCSWVNSSKYYY